MLRITEEIVILTLDPDTGEFRPSLSDHHRGLVMAGAVLMDLALENRIDTDPERLHLIDPTPLNDDLLDASLADIASETEPHDTAWWIVRTANRSAEVIDRAVGRLSDRGILSRDDNGAILLSWLVSRLHRYPEIDGESRDDIETRMLRALFSDDIPDSRDILIVALATACNLFETIFSSEKLAEARGRIELITKLDLIGRTVSDSIQAIVESPPSSPKNVRGYEEIPAVPGLPLLGNGLQMAGDMSQFIADSYIKYGPIFRIRAFGRRFVVLAGPEANELVAKISATHLRTYETYADLGSAAGALRVIPGMDGPEHLRIRKLLAKGFSPKPLETRLDVAHELTRRIVADWPDNRPIGIRRAMQSIVVEQIGQISASVSAIDHIDDLAVYLDTLVAVHVSRLRPALTKRLPPFLRAERRLRTFVDEILAAHAPNNREGKAPDLIDDMLEVHRLDPQFLPETDLFINVLTPYLAGVDTSANVCAFMLYSLLKHPDLLERTRAEVDAMFECGPLTAEGLRNLDITHRVAKETLRMYPIAPGTVRVASNSFEFNGYRVSAGTDVLVGITAGHHLSEHFTDPHEFDIERWSRNSPKSRRTNKAYAPMGVGRHRCLGASLAEVQIVLTIATILREAEIVLDKPNRREKIKYIPVRHLTDATKFRVLRRRHGAAPT